MSATTARPAPAAGPEPHDQKRRSTRPSAARPGRAFGSRPPAWRTALRYLLLVAVFALMVGPFLWQLSTSLKGPGEDIYSYPPRLLPSDATLDNYAGVARIIPVWDYALNSLTVAVASVLTNLVGASLAGYALARLRFKGRGAALTVFIMAMLVPLESIIIAQFTLARALHVNNTLLGVVLPGAVGALNVLLMRNAFSGLPYEVEEAALVDGANVWQRFVRIALPSVKGTLAVVAIFSFMTAWDDFLWPLIVLSDPANFTLTVGLNYLHGTFADNQRLVAAGTIIAVLPLIVMFACLQRYFFRGVGEGAVKG
ncbi:carbohydrate ABC transporter permease [Streptomyces albus]|uniref:carbohydrate ABC transporter permease n=1 Tax=Streptomyces TaxID=1883 RepID=UPI0004BD82A7|nr:MULTISPECIES: carbohydrate ABC transporter permease [Streptomyces]GHJ20999.1 ABC transporter permease [Streptomyces albus]